MSRTLVNETLKKVGEVVTLKGWVDTVRDHGKITFIDLRDRTGIIQCVGANLTKVTQESAIELIGKIVERPEKLMNADIETGKIELQIEKLELVSLAQELPFDISDSKMDVSLPVLLDNRPLTLKNKKQSFIFNVQEKIADGFRKAAKDLGCTEIFVPTIAISATEGGAEVFKVDYYGHQAYMTQSPQLYKQMMIPSLERVFTISKAYRAEPSVTTRHLSESTQMDCEIGFTDFDELLESLEYVAKTAVNNAVESLKLPKVLIPEKFPVLKMREAQEIIFDRTGIDHRTEKDLDPNDEKEIAKWAEEEKKSDFVVITHYPTKKRSFYTMPDPTDPEFSLSYDLLFRGLEILSGSQRINKYDDLVKEIKTRGMNPDDFEMYLSSFKYGMPPEGGFSFGLERMTMKLLDLENVREASLFPRDMERVDVRLSTVSSQKFDVYENIISLLDSKNIEYKKYEHEPVFTSDDAAKIRGTTIHQGAKALVLQADKEFILYVLPADLKADLEKIQETQGYKKLAMASKESVKAKTGLEVGCIPPLGSSIGLKTLVDSRLSENKEIAFNAGRHDRSVKMSYKDFVLVEKPNIVDIK